MKKHLFSLAVILSVLYLSNNLWLGYKSNLVFHTDLKETSPIVLQYKESSSNNLLQSTAKVDKNGILSFSLKIKTLEWFKLNLPERTMLQSSQFRGWTKQDVSLTQNNEYKGEILKGRLSIPEHKLIFLLILGYYLSWFLMYCWKYGFPVDEPKFPEMLNLEFLRIIFTLTIVFYHISRSLKVWNEGSMAVQFFFILSGFLLVYTFKSEQSVLGFIKSKIIRFCPLIIYAALVRGIFTNNISVTNVLSDCLLLPAPGLSKQPGLVNISWYICCLFWASLFYFYIIKAFKKEIVNVLIGVMVFVCYVGIVSKGWNPWLSVNDFVKTNMLQALSGMGVGYFLAQFVSQVNFAKKTFFYNMFEIGVLVYTFFAMYIQKLEPTNHLYYIMLFFSLLVCFIQKGGILSFFFEKNIFARLAKYCLAIYLSHGVIVNDLLKHMMQKYPHYFQEHLLFTYSMFIFLSCLLGIIVHHVVEIPMTRVLKKV